METVQTRALQKADISVLSPLSSTSTIGLFVSPTAPADPLVLGDFVSPTFTGYARVVLTTQSDGLNADGAGIIKSDLLAQFKVTTAGTAQIIYGWFVQNSGGTSLEAYGFFDSPIAMTNVDDTINLTPFLYALFKADADVEFIAGS